MLRAQHAWQGSWKHRFRGWEDRPNDAPRRRRRQFLSGPAVIRLHSPRPPLVPLLLVILGNFVGEEIYFRGYLQKRLSWLGPYRAVLAGNFLFLSYHLWQAPVNWAMLPVFFLVPLCYLMAWRKSLWVAIAAHVVFNLGAFDLIFEAAKGMAGR